MFTALCRSTLTLLYTLIYSVEMQNATTVASKRSYYLKVGGSQEGNVCTKYLLLNISLGSVETKQNCGRGGL